MYKEIDFSMTEGVEENAYHEAIAIALSTMRPGSMQNRLLEAMVNKPGNGIPRMTYDLELANLEFEKQMSKFQVPSVWELIGLDIAPYPGLWEKMEYAKDNVKAIRSAAYNLKENLESQCDEEGNNVGVSLFIFNKNGPINRDINVVTFDPEYCNAQRLSHRKSAKILSSNTVKATSRLRINGRNDADVIRELASMFDTARKQAKLSTGLGDAIRNLENN